MVQKFKNAKSSDIPFLFKKNIVTKTISWF